MTEIGVGCYGRHMDKRLVDDLQDRKKIGRGNDEDVAIENEDSPEQNERESKSESKGEKEGTPSEREEWM